MDRLGAPITFQHKNTRSLKCLRIILDQDRPVYTLGNLVQKNPISCELLETVRGDANLS
jgi:hypothetical protein